MANLTHQPYLTCDTYPSRWMDGWLSRERVFEGSSSVDGSLDGGEGKFGPGAASLPIPIRLVPWPRSRSRTVEPRPSIPSPPLLSPPLPPSKANSNLGSFGSPSIFNYFFLAVLPPSKPPSPPLPLPPCASFLTRLYVSFTRGQDLETDIRKVVIYRAGPHIIPVYCK